MLRRPSFYALAAVLLATATSTRAQVTQAQPHTAAPASTRSTDLFSPFVYDALGATPSVNVRARKAIEPAASSSLGTTGSTAVSDRAQQRADRVTTARENKAARAPGLAQRDRAVQ